MTVLALLGPLGPWEIILIALALLLLFGRRLPEVGRSLGQGLLEFKKGVQGVKDKIDPETPVESATPDASPQPAGTTPTTPDASPAAPATLGKTCPSCQGPVAADAKFCPACGASLQDPDAHISE